MKSLLLIILLFTIVPAINLLGQNDCKLMTYNIRLDAKSDGEDNWEHRKNAVVTYLDSEKPDIFGIQEGLPNQISFIDQSLQKYSFLGDGREGVGKGEYSAIFFDSTKWKVFDSGMFWLSDTPDAVSIGWDAACHRVCTWGIFGNEENANFAVFNTHFDHLGAEARENSARLVIDRILEIAEDLPVVFIGDLNFRPEGSPYELLISHFTDAGTVFESSQQSCGTYNGFKLKGFENIRIDYIFFKGKIDIKKYKEDQPMTPEGRQLSDHFPVIAELKIY